MKIKNEYIEIKKGNKVFTKRNMILDVYLHQIFNSQIDDEHDTSTIGYCFIKFDEPIGSITYESDVDPKDYFDVVLYSIKNYNPIVKTSSNVVKLIYKYNSDLNFLYNNGTSWVGKGMNTFNMFAGRRITALGFGTYNKLFAFLDTRNMNIVVNRNESVQISRVDSIQSDGIVVGYEYPLHLIQDAVNQTALGRQNKICAQLYSIGFGNVMGLMEEEYLIDDVTTTSDNNSITFNVNRTKKVGHYPSKNLQLGFYPTMDNSKYLIFKYRLYRRILVDDEYITNYLDEYYTMNMANENFGNLQIKLEIERM